MTNETSVFSVLQIIIAMLLFCLTIPLAISQFIVADELKKVFKRNIRAFIIIWAMPIIVWFSIITVLLISYYKNIAYESIVILVVMSVLYSVYVMYQSVNQIKRQSIIKNMLTKKIIKKYERTKKIDGRLVDDLVFIGINSKQLSDKTSFYDEICELMINVIQSTCVKYEDTRLDVLIKAIERVTFENSNTNIRKQILKLSYQCLNKTLSLVGERTFDKHEISRILYLIIIDSIKYEYHELTAEIITGRYFYYDQMYEIGKMAIAKDNCGVIISVLRWFEKNITNVPEQITSYYGVISRLLRKNNLYAEMAIRSIRIVEKKIDIGFPDRVEEYYRSLQNVFLDNDAAEALYNLVYNYTSKRVI